MVTIFGVGTFVVGAGDGHLAAGEHLRDRPLDRPPVHVHPVLTGVVFIATELALFWFLWKYDGKTNTEPVKFTHGSHTLEICWTIVPAATLLFIAIYQMNAWADAKMRRPNAGGQPECLHRGSDRPAIRVAAALSGGRRRRSLGTQGRHVRRQRSAPAGERRNARRLKSMDVLHSFFLPNLRVKQDAVPGMKIPVWFRPHRKTGSYDTRLRRAVRLGTLQDERPADGRIARRHIESHGWNRNRDANRTPRQPPAAGPQGSFGMSTHYALVRTHTT